MRWPAHGGGGAVRTEARKGLGAVRIQERGPGTFAGSKGGDGRQSLYGPPSQHREMLRQLDKDRGEPSKTGETGTGLCSKGFSLCVTGRAEKKEPRPKQ